MSANGWRELGEIPFTSEGYLACAIFLDAESASCRAKANI
jgi:hypothetical protein